MQKFNKVCLLCGKTYEYCTSCAKDVQKPSYLKEFCSEECNTIYATVVRYERKELTKEEARKILIKNGANEKVIIHKTLNKLIAEILKEDKVASEKTIEENTDERVVSFKGQSKRKQRNK